MVSFSFLTSGLTVCFVVSLYRCEVNDGGYNKLLVKMESSVGSEKFGFLGKRGKGIFYTFFNAPPPNTKEEKTGSFLLRYLADRIFGRSSPQDQACCKPENLFIGPSSGEEGNQATLTNSEESMFATGIRDLRVIYEECQTKIRKRLRRKFEGMENNLSKMRDKLISLYNCMKVFSFRQLDDFLSYDVIPISNYLEFVRDIRNGTNPQERRDLHSYDVEILTKNWIDLTLERIEKLLNGHSLKFRIGSDVNQGRGRRRDHRMFAMMMMGFVIMASILVPMGFQFLTVLGGKSLLMAKMALIMSAINGLKKIATSNVGYGLYHAGPEAFHHDPHHHGFHEKIFHIKAQEQPESPFNVVI